MHVAKIIKPYYDWNGRKYMLLQIDEVLYQIKVPYRYNRVMCNVCGIKPIQEYTKDEIVLVTYEKRVWNDDTHYVLVSLRPSV